MRLRTLPLYLIGNRQAILEIASDPRAIWIGLLFVLSAGLAREYDAADLWGEYHPLFTPLAVSVAASLLLFLVGFGSMYLYPDPSGTRPPFWTAYRSFLALFWMTAPLAWLYAVPYERFLTPVDGTAANLWTLAVVATWRVLLMARVIAVITGRRMITSFFLVMIFASATAFAAAAVVPPVKIVGFMGGTQVPEVTEQERLVNRTIDPSQPQSPTGERAPSEREVLVREVAGWVRILGFCSAPLWLIGGVIAFFASRPVWRVPAAPPEPLPPARGMWVLAAVSIAVWIPLAWLVRAI
jgi:hypothetical protein